MFTRSEDRPQSSKSLDLRRNPQTQGFDVDYGWRTVNAFIFGYPRLTDNRTAVKMMRMMYFSVFKRRSIFA
ncbi:hypothetical protein ATY79_16255 [Rhizobium sp. R693]|nr:hypothetical protein ATY79_16255 [Rhizobium sp. R693]